jgi:hypothetical protein
MVDGVPDSLPRDAGMNVPGARISMHAVLVGEGGARFDDAALRGGGIAGDGLAWCDSPSALEAPARWLLVWVAVTHEPDGSRAYSGLSAEEFWVDAEGRRGYRAPGRGAHRDVALRGGVAVDGLDADQRAALRSALLAEDADAWDRASAAVLDALRTDTARP